MYWPIWTLDGVTVEKSLVIPVKHPKLGLQRHYDDGIINAFVVRSSILRDQNGEPVSVEKFGKSIPPEVPAAIVAGETTLAPWTGLYDPNQSGPYGRCTAWREIQSRFPQTLYDRIIGQPSYEAREQYKGLSAIVDSPDVKALSIRLGKKIAPETIMGSCGAGAVGRTQIMPVHFAPGHMMATMNEKDVWNNPLAISEGTIRHLFQRGCSGGWYVSEDPWSVWCGYNPGAWGKYPNYWNSLSQAHA